MNWSVAIFSFITSFFPNFTTSESLLTSDCFFLQCWVTWEGMWCFLLIFVQDEIIVTGSSLLLEFLTAPAVEAALPSAGRKLGARRARCLGLPVEDKNHALSSAKEVFFPLTGERLSVRQKMLCPVPGNAHVGFNECILLAWISYSCHCKIFLSQILYLTWCFVMLLSLNNKHTSLVS